MEIPANTSAAIHLPGTEGEPLEVGSGRYRWSYPYQAPAVVFPPLTIDSTLGDLIDQPAVYAQVMHVVAQHNPEFADRMDGQGAVSLRQAIHRNPNAQELEAKVEEG